MANVIYQNNSILQRQPMIESSLTSKLSQNIVKADHQQHQHPRYIFHFEIDPEEDLIRIDIDIDPQTIVEEAILCAVDQFNRNCQEKGFELVRQIQLYSPRLPKKNGRPKVDMPRLEIHQKICDLKISTIAIQVTNKTRAVRLKPQKTESAENISNMMRRISTVIQDKRKEQIQDYDESARTKKRSECFCSFC